MITLRGNNDSPHGIGFEFYFYLINGFYATLFYQGRIFF